MRRSHFCPHPPGWKLPVDFQTGDSKFECIVSLIYNTSERVATRFLKSISFAFCLNWYSLKIKVAECPACLPCSQCIYKKQKILFQGFTKEMEYVKHALRKFTDKRAWIELLQSNTNSRLSAWTLKKSKGPLV